jgi:hypothetical protein
MLISIISDSHFGVKSDSESFYEVQKDFFTGQFFPKLKELGITKIVHLGDIFDKRKYINIRTIQHFNECFLNHIDDFTLDILLGNHDTFYKDTNRINSPSLLMNHPNATLYENTEEIELDGLKILYAPWLCRDNLEHFQKLKNETTAKVCFGHFDFSGFEMLKGIKSEHGFDKKDFKKFDLVLSGHYHTKSSQDNIHYLGTQYEITWSDYNDPKGFHIFDTDTLELTFIQNPLAYHHKIYYNDTLTDYSIFDSSIYKNSYIKLIVEKKENVVMFDKFVSSLCEAGVVDLKIIEDMTSIDNEAYSELENVENIEDTMTIIDNYTKSLSIDNETILKDVTSIIKNLYTEALHDD